MPQETSINAAAIAALEHIETTLKATMNQLKKALENLQAKSPEVELALEIDRFVGLRKTILAEIQRSRQQLQGQTTTQNEEALNILKELDSQVNAERWKAFVLHWHILQGPQTLYVRRSFPRYENPLTKTVRFTKRLVTTIAKSPICMHLCYLLAPRMFRILQTSPQQPKI